MQNQDKPSPTTSAAEIDRLFAAMPGDEAARVLSLRDALLAFGAAPDRAAAARALSARLAPLGLGGLSLKSLYRKLDGLRREGVWALVPAKYRRDGARGVASNAAFLGHWHGLVLENRRKLRPAWRRLLREFAAGAEVPGVGTWRDLYLAERGHLPAAGEPCPWGERTPPPGWGLRNLARFAPDPFAVEAARRGMAAAKAAYGLAVRKTRAGLACCRIVEVDDMWYEHAVVFAGNAGPQRVVEFAAMDRLTGHVVWHLAKPVRERPDGTRETLRAAWAKYVYHAVLCVSGIPPEGCVIQGEKGSATSDRELERALALVNAWRAARGLGPVEFRTGSLANAPLAKGLPDGTAKGNPRHKGMIEQMHATLKNEMGHVLGEVGGGRGVQPEETGALEAETRRLVALAGARGLSAEAVAAPFLSWPAFTRAAEEAHRNIDARTDHALEGWEACGFVAGEVRLKGEASWRSVKAMSQMTPQEAGAVAALVKAGAAEYRERRLSPREASRAARSTGSGSTRSTAAGRTSATCRARSWASQGCCGPSARTRRRTTSPSSSASARRSSPRRRAASRPSPGGAAPPRTPAPPRTSPPSASRTPPRRAPRRAPPPASPTPTSTTARPRRRTGAPGTTTSSDPQRADGETEGRN